MLRAVGVVLAAAFAFPGIYVVWRNISTDADPIGLLRSSRTLDPLGRTMQLAVLVSLASVSASASALALGWWWHGSRLFAVVGGGVVFVVGG